MTRTLHILFTVAILSLFALAVPARGDGDADQPATAPSAEAASHTPADAPAAASTAASKDQPTTADRPQNDQPRDRIRQRRDAMRDGQALAPEGDRPPADRPAIARPAGDRPEGPAGALQGPPESQRPPQPTPPLSADQQKQALDVLREINPDLAGKITEAQKTNPDRASVILRRLGPKLLELAELKSTDPDLYKLRVADQRYNFETFRLIRQIREARAAGDNAKVERLTDRLRSLLDKHFDVRTKLREHELAMLEQRISDIRAELKDHHDRKPQIIDEQIDRMIADNPPPPADTPVPGNDTPRGE